MSDQVFRRFQRKETLQRALFRSKRGVAMPVLVIDISPSGCLVQTQYLGLKPGEAVTIRPDTFEAISGTVRWKTGERAGIEFDVPLHSAIVDHLVRTAITEADINRRKSFGIAESLGKRLLRAPATTIERSVA